MWVRRFPDLLTDHHWRSVQNYYDGSTWWIFRSTVAHTQNWEKGVSGQTPAWWKRTNQISRCKNWRNEIAKYDHRGMQGMVTLPVTYLWVFHEHNQRFSNLDLGLKSRSRSRFRDFSLEIFSGFFRDFKIPIPIPGISGFSRFLLGIFSWISKPDSDPRGFGIFRSSRKQKIPIPNPLDRDLRFGIPKAPIQKPNLSITSKYLKINLILWSPKLKEGSKFREVLFWND